MEWSGEFHGLKKMGKSQEIIGFRGKEGRREEENVNVRYGED